MPLFLAWDPKGGIQRQGDIGLKLIFIENLEDFRYKFEDLS
jgi:hypothetical protein